jgi:hypothetical protein
MMTEPIISAALSWSVGITCEYVKGDRDAAVAEPLLDDLRVHAVLQSDRRVAVPQVVQSDDWYAGVFRLLLERPGERGPA